MKIELEIKKFMEHWTGEVDTNEIFYRYNIDGNLVWFSQMQDSGNIYAVYVRLKECFNECFDVWIHCNFYPDDIDIEVKNSHIKQAEVERVISDINYINNLCDVIMSIFKSEEHYGLWCKRNREEDGNYCELCGMYIGQGFIKICDKCASEFKF